MMADARAEFGRLIRCWTVWAQASLVEGAVRNAALTLADRQAGRLDEARTLRDLNRISPPPGRTRVEGAPGRAAARRPPPSRTVAAGRGSGQAR